MQTNLVAVELGDGLGAFRHGVLGELAWEQQTDGRLDFPGRDRRALVVARQAASLAGNALKQIADEVIHDRHRLLGDARVWVHLLQHLVDVRGVPKKMKKKKKLKFFKIIFFEKKKLILFQVNLRVRAGLAAVSSLLSCNWEKEKLKYFEKKNALNTKKKK